MEDTVQTTAPTRAWGRSEGGITLNNSAIDREDAKDAGSSKHTHTHTTSSPEPPVLSLQSPHEANGAFNCCVSLGLCIPLPALSPMASVQWSSQPALFSLCPVTPTPHHHFPLACCVKITRPWVSGTHTCCLLQWQEEKLAGTSLPAGLGG